MRLTGHNSIVARVRGTRLYEVKVQFVESTGVLKLACSCPVGELYGEACKHLWAVLRRIDAEDLLPSTRRAPKLYVELLLSDLDDDDDFDEEGDDVEEGSAPPPTAHAILNDLIESAAVEKWTSHRVPARRFAVLLDRDSAPDGPLELTIVAALGGGYVEVPAEQLLHFATPGSVEADLALLAMRQPGASAWPAALPSRQFRDDDSRLWLSGSEARAILEPLARSGQLLVESGDRASSVTWAEVEPRLCLTIAVRAAEAGYLLRGHLALGKRKVGIQSLGFAHASGICIVNGEIMALGTGVEAQWLSILRRHAADDLLLAPDELEAFLERYYSTPDLPAIVLPNGLALPLQRAEPQPFVDIGSSDGSSQGLPVHVGLRYAAKEVALSSDARWVVDLAANARYERAKELEHSMFTELLALGVRPFRSGDTPAEAKSFRVAAKRVGEVVTSLIARGWSVSVQRKPYRRLGGMRLSGSSGIDWLEISGTAEVDGEELPLGELMRALRQKRRTGALVELGSQTVVAPEELLDRLERLLELGAGSDEANSALRLSRAHAGAAISLLDSASSSQEDADFGKLRACLEQGLTPTAASAPRGFRGTLREYQRQGLGWLRWLEQAGFSGCLADDMGLGKTVQVLALLLGRARRHGPALVVAPRSVLHNWADEAMRFAPALEPVVHWGPDRVKDPEALRRARLVITTYTTLARDIVMLSEVDWDYLVLDEAQAIKNRTTQTSRVMRSLKSNHRLALTGTPIENHLDELWALLDFLNPGFGKRAPTRNGALSASDRKLISSLIRPFVLRRTKRQVARDLPDRIEQTLEVELSRSERRRYDELCLQLRRQYSEAVAKLGVQRSTPVLLTGLLRLRQAACHQGLIDPKLRAQPSAKLTLLCERLEELKEEGAKALIFSQFTQHLDLVEPYLKRSGIGFVRLDGKTLRRAERVNEFQTNPSITAFLISLKAGGTGLNLTAAEYVFLLDPWWNPAAEAQAIDRCHRIGQTSQVVAYRLIAAGTIEEKVAELQRRKRELVDSVLGDDEAFLGKLTREDLAILLG